MPQIVLESTDLAKPTASPRRTASRPLSSLLLSRLLPHCKHTLQFGDPLQPMLAASSNALSQRSVPSRRSCGTPATSPGAESPLIRGRYDRAAVDVVLFTDHIARVGPRWRGSVHRPRGRSEGGFRPGGAGEDGE